MYYFLYTLCKSLFTLMKKASVSTFVGKVQVTSNEIILP